MVTFRNISLLALIPFFFSNCATTNTSNVNWPAKMNLLSFSMGKILPLANDENQFLNPKNDLLIKTELKNIYSLANELEKSEKTPDGDPMLNFSASKFAEDFKTSYQQFSLGNKKQALFTVQNMTNYCVSCHSRANFGRSDFKKSWDINFSNFTVFEKSQFHFASRQYTEGLNLVINSFDQFKKDKTNNVEIGLLNALAVSVRVKHDQELTTKIVDKVLTLKKSYLKTRAQFWKKSLIAWGKESSKDPLKREAMYQKAKDLILIGMKNKDSNNSIIEYLRASNLLHKVLMAGEKDLINADSLYLAGIAARPLKDINLWTLHEVYFEKCIYAWPQSKLAEKCYVELEKEWLSDKYLVGGKASEVIKNKLLVLKDASRLLRKDEVLQNLNNSPTQNL